MPSQTELEPEAVFDQEQQVVAVRASAFHTVIAAIQVAGMRESVALEPGEVQRTEEHGMQLKFNAAVLAVRGLGYLRALAQGSAREDEEEEEGEEREKRHARLLGLDHDLRAAVWELAYALHPRGDSTGYEEYFDLFSGVTDE